MTFNIEFHKALGASFGQVNGVEMVSHYGAPLDEPERLVNSAGVLDLTYRGRLCIGGKDRARFLHGQVTNDVKKLKVGEGCYAAIVTAKGKIESDLTIYALENELLLDFEPGLSTRISERLERYIIADDAQIVDVAGAYGLISVQGPKAEEVLSKLGVFAEIPARPFTIIKKADANVGELYLANRSRAGRSGFDIYAPSQSVAAVVDKTVTAARAIGGGVVGWDALEMARIEAGIPRFGADMDENNIVLEAGIESGAISFSKGCYIGQEVISRVQTRGQVTKKLVGLRISPAAAHPRPHDKIHFESKEVGYLTSVTRSPILNQLVGLGYVRKECNAIGTNVRIESGATEIEATIVQLPFVPL